MVRGKITIEFLDNGEIDCVFEGKLDFVDYQRMRASMYTQFQTKYIYPLAEEERLHQAERKVEAEKAATLEKMKRDDAIAEAKRLRDEKDTARRKAEIERLEEEREVTIKENEEQEAKNRERILEEAATSPLVAMMKEGDQKAEEEAEKAEIEEEKIEEEIEDEVKDEDETQDDEEVTEEDSE